jgi:sensor c-di-GMP phosphodiesterase-like protein
MIPIKRRRRLAITVLALAGATLGAVGGYWLGRVTQLQAAETGLSEYADDLVAHSEEYSRELDSIWKTFNPSKFPFCSAQEIAEMQSLSFRSTQVKEIGRTHDGKLYCSAFLGRLDPALPEPPLTLSLANGINIYSDVKLKFVAGSTGTILEHGDTDVVLSPTAFSQWSRPHTRFTVLMVNRGTNKSVAIAGDKLDARQEWVSGQGLISTAAALYDSRCSAGATLCVVTAETIQDVMARSGRFLVEYTILGAIAGFALFLAIGQSWLKHEGIARQLRRALRKDELHLVYQPILQLPCGSCAGAEALARWRDEDGNMVAPDVFIRVAEDGGFIAEITRFVVRCAIDEVGEILRQHPELVLSINIAPSELEDDGLLWLLEEHVRQAGIQPGQIALELTERSTADMSVLREAILRLHHEGYQVHIDDFGTGFSSLAYLHELAVDAIKIDRAFTRTIGTQAVTASILPQILSLAESLGAEVIVEGVETAEQADYLTATGISMKAQGWYFGKPVIATDLPKYREQAEVEAQNAMM